VDDEQEIQRWRAEVAEERKRLFGGQIKGGKEHERIQHAKDSYQKTAAAQQALGIFKEGDTERRR